jgi:hypothetical protein
LVKVALLQLRTPARLNVARAQLEPLLNRAAKAGAKLIVTPEGDRDPDPAEERGAPRKSARPRKRARGPHWMTLIWRDRPESYERGDDNAAQDGRMGRPSGECRLTKDSLTDTKSSKRFRSGFRGYSDEYFE